MVVGLGILGQSIARTLAAEGAEVIAIDSDPTFIETVKDEVAMAVLGDSTDPKLLEQLGARDLDVAIVCIGENFAGAVLTTAHLLDLKVKHVATRATDALKASIFKRMGSHEVFFVENEMGRQIAHRLQSPHLLHEMELGGGLTLVEWMTPDWMIGKKVADLALRNQFQVQIVAIRNPKIPEDVNSPTADTVIHAGQNLLLVGKMIDLNRLLDDQK